MIHHQRFLDIDAAPEAVWAVISRYMHIDEFAPAVVSVDALTDATEGLGARRRCHFENGTSVEEVVIRWDSGHGYRVSLSNMDAMPLHEAEAGLTIKPLANNRSRVVWSFDYRVKYGPLGWLLGQTLMKMMMGKVLDGNLQGLAHQTELPISSAVAAS